jgi:hypothetical protein
MFWTTKIHLDIMFLDNMDIILFLGNNHVLFFILKYLTIYMRMGVTRRMFEHIFWVLYFIFC